MVGNLGQIARGNRACSSDCAPHRIEPLPNHPLSTDLTEKVLLEALKAEPATSVRFNTEVTPLEQREDGVQLQLSSGESLPPNGGGG